MDMKKLLAATAVAALVAGTNLAIAQSTTASSPTGASKSGPSPASASPAAAAKDDAGTPAAGDKVPHQRTGQSEMKPAHKNAQKGHPGQSNPSHASDMKKDKGDAHQRAQRGDVSDSDAAKPGRHSGSRAGADEKPGRHSGSRAEADKKSTTGIGGSGALTAEKRTRIKQTIVKSGKAPRVNNVNFSISVGTTVPRSVTLVAVPSAVIEIYPAWRGYEYFITGNQIVIVDPGTMEIVAVLPA